MPSTLPDKHDLESLYEQKFQDLGDDGWGPPTRRKFGYYTPDDFYEALLRNLIDEGTVWADVGCGRDIFPSNAALAEELAARCSTVIGIDPDPNIDENRFVSEAHKMMIEDFSTGHEIDLITLRMVAEHIADPAATIGILAGVVRPGGLVVIYTPHKWAPVSVVARATPMSIHHAVKSALWDTEEQDTFPVEYRMNTRSTLRRQFEAAGFSEHTYALLDDCRIFSKYRLLNYLDLCFWRFCRFTRLPYPEKCILGIYRRNLPATRAGDGTRGDSPVATHDRLAAGES